MIQFELVDDKHVRLCLKCESVEKAIEYITKQIRGEGEWKSLARLDPSTLKIRTSTLCRRNVYYDLNGKYIGLDRMGEKLLANIENLRIDIDSECYNDSTGALRDKYQRANEMLDGCISVIKKAWEK